MIEGSGRLGTFITLIELELYEDLILHSLPPLFNKHMSKLSSHGPEAYSSWTYLLKNAQDQTSDSTQPEKVTRPTESCSKGRETPKGKRRKVGGNAIKAKQGKIKLGPGQVSQ